MKKKWKAVLIACSILTAFAAGFAAMFDAPPVSPAACSWQAMFDAPPVSPAACSWQAISK